MVVVGTTTGTFFAYEMLSARNGSAMLRRVAAVTQNAQSGATTEWVVAGPRPGFFYVVDNLGFGEAHAGKIIGYRILTSSNGKPQIQRINAVSSMGRGPCFLEIDSTGRWMLVANYLEGNVAVVPIRHDGSLGAAVAVTDAPAGHARFPIPDVQDHSYAHCARLDPYVGRFVVVADAGLNLLRHYVMDAETGQLTDNGSLNMTLYRPRHVFFHPQLHVIYVLHELSSAVSVFPFSVTTGRVGPDALEVVSTVIPAGPGQGVYNEPAEVMLSPDAKFLLVSNRMHSTLAVYQVDASSGRLTALAFQESGGKNPRHFAFAPRSTDPSSNEGSLLLVGNTDSGSVAAFNFRASPHEDVPTFHLLANATDIPGVAVVAEIPLEARSAMEVSSAMSV